MMERKRAIHSWYEDGIAARPALKGVRLQQASEGDDSVWWINAALLPDGLSGEDVGMQLMKSFPDIEIRPGFYPLNSMAIFQSEWSAARSPNAELLYKRLVCLPSSNQLQKDDVERVCDALVEAIRAVSTPQKQVEFEVDTAVSETKKVELPIQSFCPEALAWLARSGFERLWPRTRIGPVACADLSADRDSLHLVLALQLSSFRFQSAQASGSQMYHPVTTRYSQV
eukprot:s2916_g9.t1